MILLLYDEKITVMCSGITDKCPLVE